MNSTRIDYNKWRAKLTWDQACYNINTQVIHGSDKTQGNALHDHVISLVIDGLTLSKLSNIVSVVLYP
jgi:hypothetical protein